MHKLLIKYISIVGVLYLFTAFMKDITISSDIDIFLFALVIFLCGLLVRPLFLVLLLPFNLFTFGLLTIFANTFTIMLADFFMSSVSIGSFINCFLLSIPVYFLNWFINSSPAQRKV